MSIGLHPMLLEDNPSDAELMVRAFKKRNLANNLTHVEDGTQALDVLFGRGKFEGRKPSSAALIVFLDLKPPKSGGLEVLREIKGNQNTYTSPVVIVTSSAEDPDVQRAYALGANSYVVKPANFESFIEEMGNLGCIGC